MALLNWIRENKAIAVTACVVLAWFLFRHSITSWFCGESLFCWLYADSWPSLLGINSSSSPLLIGFLAAFLFALPLGRSGLLATLVGIHLAEPVFGFLGVAVLFVFASVASIILVQGVVEYGLRHPKAALIHLRLKPINSIFGSSIRKNGLLWISIGNLVGSQWQMGALGVLAGVRRETIWLGLLLGNLAGFVLVYFFSQVTNLDAVSVVLMVVILASAISLPALLNHLKPRRFKPKHFPHAPSQSQSVGGVLDSINGFIDSLLGK